VLVQFWTYTCINWLRTLPYVRAWARRLDGLQVLTSNPRPNPCMALCISGIISRNLVTGILGPLSEGGLPRWSVTVLRRNRTQTNSLIGVLVAAVACSVIGMTAAQPNPQKDVERVIRDFLVAFSNRDFAVFVPYFSEDATVFFPPSAAAPLGRVQGRSEIERAFKTIFDAYPPRTTRAPTPIAPQDLLIQDLDGHAVVTFQLGSETARQRRTLVLKRSGDEWKIVHLHGSASVNQP
jgi:ketosteroid isomerase-like protein